MTQGHNSFLHYSTGYKHLAGMIRREINNILTRTVLCAWSGTLQGRLFRRAATRSPRLDSVDSQMKV
jgi:hypothetical protein